MENKKSIQLNQAFGAVLTLVLVAVLIIIAIFLFVTLSTSFSGTTSVTVTNETSAFINATGYTIANIGACSIGDITLTEATNETNGTAGFPIIPIAAANYTFTTATGTITNATAFNFASANISYTYTWGSGACDASEDMATEFGNYTSLVGLVGTIIFLGLVIGVLVAAFVFGGRRET